MAVASLVVRISALTADLEKGLAGAERSLKRTGGQFESIGKKLTQGLTLPIAALVGTTAKAAIDFESSFAGVRKTVDATEGEFAQLAQGFRDLAKAMPLSVNEINRVAEAAGQLGVGKDRIKDFTATMVKLGTTTNLTADEAAAAMARFANAMGNPTVDVNKLGAALTALGNAGASTERDILELAGRLAGAGAQIGLSEASVFGMANALSSVGINAEKGGTAFSKLFFALNKAVSDGGKQLRSFAEVAGLSADNFSRLFTADAAGAVTKFIEGLHAQKQAGTDLLKVMDALNITETRYRDTVLLAANAGPQFAASIKLGNDAFREGTALNVEYGERLKTTQSQLILLKNNVQDVAITMGQSMLPVINDAVTSSRPFVSALADMASSFRSLPEPIKNTTFALAGLLAALGPIAFIVGKVISAWSGLIAAIRYIPIIAGTASAAFLAITAALTGVSTGITGATGVVYLLRGALLAVVGPAGAFVGAIAAIVAALPKAADGIRGMASAIAQGRFWEFVTTKDAPAIWEKEFWGISRGADAAAVSIRRLGTASKDVNLPLEGVENLRSRLAGEGLALEVAKLEAAFKALTPEQKQSADVMARVAADAAALKASGAKLSVELDKIARSSKKASGGLSFLGGETQEQTKEAKRLAKETREIAAALDSLNGKLRQGFSGKLPGFTVNVKELKEFALFLPTVIKDVDALSQAYIRNNLAIDQAVSTGAIFRRKQDEISETLDFARGRLEAQEDALNNLAGTFIAFGRVVEGPSGHLVTASVQIYNSVRDIKRSFEELQRLGSGAQWKDALNFGSNVALLGLNIASSLAAWDDAQAEMRKARQRFVDEQGGLFGLQNATLTAGLGDAAARLMKASGNDIKDQIERITRATAEADARLARYNLTWRDLSQEIRQSNINQMARDLIADMGALSKVGVDAVSSMGAAFSNLVVEAVNTGSQIPVALQPTIEQLIRMGGLTEEAAAAMLGLRDDTMPSLADITAAADRYGLSLDQLGPKVQQLKINETAAQIVKDFELLMLAGSDAGVVMDAMKEKVQAIVRNALDLGLEVPDSMRPMLQKMVDAGMLTDAAGQALKDLSGINFAEPIAKKIDDLIAALDRLIDKFSDVNSEAERMAQRRREILGQGPGPVTTPTGAGAARPRPTFQQDPLGGVQIVPSNAPTETVQHITVNVDRDVIARASARGLPKELQIQGIR